MTPKDGEKWRAVQRRWVMVADGVDRRTADCAVFYDELSNRLAHPDTEPSR